MPEKVRWGILGTASIATRRVIPAMQRGEWTTIAAVASRQKRKAEEVAAEFNIPKAYGSYEDVLADPSIEAVYIPLPNHLHLEWSTKAAEAGKHVLCEKPITLNAAEARELLAVRDRVGMKISEAFMVRTHPRWLRIRELVRNRQIGRLRAVMASVGYFNRDLRNIRNSAAAGGGALLDIGCYPVTLSRFLFGEEPARVAGSIERDPETHTDVLTSAILEFPSGRCVFNCSTQLAYTQWMQLLGSDAHVHVDRPINPLTDQPSRIEIDDGKAAPGSKRIEEVPACNQFTIQGDLFSRAIRGNGPAAVPLEDSIDNMAAIDAIFRSAESGRWEIPQLVR
jgi:predicted dehydrogenase